MSPRWSSDYPRMLLVLALELEPHLGEVLKLFPKTKNPLMSARLPCTVSRRNPTSVYEGRTGWILLVPKCKAQTVVGRGEKSLLCDPGSELRLGGRGNKKGKDNDWDGRKNNYDRDPVMAHIGLCGPIQTDRFFKLRAGTNGEKQNLKPTLEFGGETRMEYKGRIRVTNKN